jgi:hypothetical protein
MKHRTRDKRPIDKIRIGPSTDVSVFAFGKEEFGLPLVQLTGALESLENLKPEQALLLGEALIAAAMIAAYPA